MEFTLYLLDFALQSGHEFSKYTLHAYTLA